MILIVVLLQKQLKGLDPRERSFTENKLQVSLNLDLDT